MQLDSAVCDDLREQLHARPGATMKIDLPAQTVTGPDGAAYRFEIDAFRKKCLLEGLDDIGITLQHDAAIAAFENAISQPLRLAIPLTMETSDKTARQLFEEIKANPTRKRFGFGRKPALINIDLQKAYTAVGEFATAYETDPKQLDYVNQLAAAFRAKSLPVVWTYVAYMDSGEDCGVWGTRTNTPDSLQNIKVGSRRSEFDERLDIDRKRDIIVNKRMASAFHETNLQSVFTFHGVDTVIVTGGSTSGCVRATVVDSLSRSYRTIVPRGVRGRQAREPALRQPLRHGAQIRATSSRSRRFWSTCGR